MEEALAVGLLRPLGHAEDAPLNDFELAALEELAGLPPERDRVRILFLAKALERASTAGQLGRRLEQAVTAAVGLDLRRRERALVVVAERLSDPKAPAEVRLVAARLAGALGARGEVGRQAGRVLDGLVVQRAVRGAELAALFEEVQASLEPEQLTTLASRIALLWLEGDAPRSLKRIPPLLYHVRAQEAEAILRELPRPAPGRGTPADWKLEEGCEVFKVLAPRVPPSRAREVARDLLAGAVQFLEGNPNAIGPVLAPYPDVIGWVEPQEARLLLSRMATCLARRARRARPAEWQELAGLLRVLGTNIEPGAGQHAAAALAWRWIQLRVEDPRLGPTELRTVGWWLTGETAHDLVRRARALPDPAPDLVALLAHLRPEAARGAALRLSAELPVNPALSEVLARATLLSGLHQGAPAEARALARILAGRLVGQAADLDDVDVGLVHRAWGGLCLSLEPLECVELGSVLPVCLPLPVAQHPDDPPDGPDFGGRARRADTPFHAVLSFIGEATDRPVSAADFLPVACRLDPERSERYKALLTDARPEGTEGARRRALAGAVALLCGRLNPDEQKVVHRLLLGRLVASGPRRTELNLIYLLDALATQMDQGQVADTAAQVIRPHLLTAEGEEGSALLAGVHAFAVLAARLDPRDVPEIARIAVYRIRTRSDQPYLVLDLANGLLTLAERYRRPDFRPHAVQALGHLGRRCVEDHDLAGDAEFPRIRTEFFQTRRRLTTQEALLVPSDIPLPSSAVAKRPAEAAPLPGETTKGLAARFERECRTLPDLFALVREVEALPLSVEDRKLWRQVAGLRARQLVDLPADPDASLRDAALVLRLLDLLSVPELRASAEGLALRHAIAVAKSERVVNGASFPLLLVGLRTPQILDLLKHPTCTGDLRHMALEELGRRARRRFRNTWEVARWVGQELLDYDLAGVGMLDGKTPQARRRRSGIDPTEAVAGGAPESGSGAEASAAPNMWPPEAPRLRSPDTPDH